MQIYLLDEFVPSCIFDFPILDENFVMNFNQNPIITIQQLLKDNRHYSNPFYLGRFLCIKSGLNPLSVYTVLNANSTTFRTSLFHFFSAFNIEFSNIIKVTSMLLPKISLPVEKKNLLPIIESLTDSFLNQNMLINICKEDIFLIMISIIIFGLKRKLFMKIEFDEFLFFFKNSKLSNESLKYLFKQIEKNDIALSIFNVKFESKPNTNKKGILKRSRRFFSMKKRSFKINGDYLLIYDDLEFKELYDKIYLFETFHQVTNNPKFGFSLEISKIDGTELEFFNKNKKIEKQNELIYSLFDDNKNELDHWAECLNLSTFCSSICQLGNLPSSIF